jgi:hypothetical protein
MAYEDSQHLFLFCIRARLEKKETIIIDNLNNRIFDILMEWKYVSFIFTSKNRFHHSAFYKLCCLVF